MNRFFNLPEHCNALFVSWSVGTLLQVYCFSILDMCSVTQYSVTLDRNRKRSAWKMRPCMLNLEPCCCLAYFISEFTSSVVFANTLVYSCSHTAANICFPWFLSSERHTGADREAVLHTGISFRVSFLLYSVSHGLPHWPRIWGSIR